MKPVFYLELASSLSRSREDERTFCLCAVAVRKDGCVVFGLNGCPPEPDPKHHAEYRVSRKLDQGAVVYVARTLSDGTWALAKPCSYCRARLKNKGVVRVYYTIKPNEYGCLVLGAH